MKLPLQVTFRNLESTESMEADISKKAEKLNQYFDNIRRTTSYTGIDGSLVT